MGKMRALAGVAIVVGVLAGTWKMVTPAAPEETSPEDDGAGSGHDRGQLLAAIEDLALEVKRLGGDSDRVEQRLQDARESTVSELAEIRSELRDLRSQLEDGSHGTDEDDDEPSEPQQE